MRIGWRNAVIFLLYGIVGTAATAQSYSPQEILDHLNRTIDWHRQIIALDAAPINSQDLVLRETARQQAKKALQLAFTVARAQGNTLQSTSGGAPTTSSSNATRARLAASAAANAQLVSQLQNQLTQLNQDVAKAPPDQAPPLIARRDEIASELNFAKTRQDALQDYLQFMSGLDSGSAAGLLQQIDSLEKSIPDLQTAAQTTTSKGPDSTSNSTQFRQENAGILGLIEELFSLGSRLGEIKHSSERTQHLLEANDKLRTPLRPQLQEAIRQGEAATRTAQSDDTAALAAKRQRFDRLNNQLKELTAIALPLGEQKAVLETTNGTLTEWHATIMREYERLTRALLLRLAGLAAVILVLLIISKLSGTLALRYVTDVRRRRQFLLLRRIVVGSIITMILIASVVAEFGSLATFAGLITAGIAVALQSVILSGCAYFFFIGRYGVRVGDRVTISNITGDVIDIGLFRLYLMELAGTSRDLAPTGRIVIFSNSVLFQPSAFYKQLPGADYVWHEVALTLSPDTDHRLAEERLLGAVQSVFETYRATIEKQYTSVKQSLHLSIATPRPFGRLRLVEAGLEYVIRYPVDIHRSGEIDDSITRKLLDAIEQEPRLKLVSSGTPRIQPAAEPAAQSVAPTPH